MKQIEETADVQKYAYSLLVKFHEYCEKNGLRYTLAYGTLLGAIRHEGFIPWDDDIDVVMPRPDYEKFLLLSKDHGIGDKTAVIWEKNLERPYFSYTKVIDTETVLYDDVYFENKSGLFIDVFPMDGVPSEKRECIKHFRKCNQLAIQLQLSTMRIKKGRNWITTLGKCVILPLARIVCNPRRIIQKVNKLATNYDFEDSKLVAVTVYGKSICESTEREKFWNRELAKFEDRLFYIPSNYEEWLTNMYGDYMKLPPENKRVSTHGFLAYAKES